MKIEGIEQENLKNLNELEKIVKKERGEGKVIVFINGCFDILHKGHICILEKAETFGQVLIVAINSDKYIRKFKGEGRPKNNELDRAYILGRIKGVDYVTIFNESEPLKLLKTLKPDFNVKGGAFIPERVENEKKIMDSYGGKIVTLPLIEGYSTTKTIDSIRNKIP